MAELPPSINTTPPQGGITACPNEKGGPMKERIQKHDLVCLALLLVLLAVMALGAP